MRNKYDKKTIARACKLYKEGTPLRAILRDTGIKSSSSVLFACNLEYRASMVERGREWRKKNPERWIEIVRKSEKKTRSKKS